MSDLFVIGVPRPQGSMRGIVSKSTGRVFMKGSDTTAAWRNAVVAALAEAIELGQVDVFPDGPVRVELRFFFSRPKSHSKRRRDSDQRVKYNGSDIDKLARAILDAMTVAGAVGDDTQVSTLTANKSYTSRVEGVSIVWMRESGGYKKADGSYA